MLGSGAGSVKILVVLLAVLVCCAVGGSDQQVRRGCLGLIVRGTKMSEKWKKMENQLLIENRRKGENANTKK